MLTSYFFGLILRPAGAKYIVGKLEKRMIRIQVINILYHQRAFYLQSGTKGSPTKHEIKGLKPEYYTEVTHDSPADFIWRWHIVGCGVHLGDDNVGIISKL